MLGEKSSNNTIYLNVRRGQFARYLGKEDPGYNGAVREESEKGNISYYKYHPYVIGKIVSCKLEENQFGEEVVNMVLEDIGEIYKIELPSSRNGKLTRVFTDFTNRALGIDLSKDVRLAIWTQTPEGKDYAITRLSIQQELNGEFSPVAYSKEKGEIPFGVEKKVGKKKVWDFTERDAALYNIFDEFTELLNKTKETPQETATPVSEESENDLPFD